MRWTAAIVLAAALLGCGVETVTTAATVAAGRKMEVEQGKKTAEQMQQSIAKSMDQAQQNAERTEEAAK
jgi:hypothetical protein